MRGHEGERPQGGTSREICKQYDTVRGARSCSQDCVQNLRHPTVEFRKTGHAACWNRRLRWQGVITEDSSESLLWGMWGGVAGGGEGWGQAEGWRQAEGWLGGWGWEEQEGWGWQEGLGRAGAGSEKIPQTVSRGFTFFHAAFTFFSRGFGAHFRVGRSEMGRGGRGGLRADGRAGGGQAWRAA